MKTSREKTSQSFVSLLIGLVLIQKLVATILVACTAVHIFVKERPDVILACCFRLYLELVLVSDFAPGKLVGDVFKVRGAQPRRLIFVFWSIVGERRQIQQLLLKILDIF
jgi:hypothetical protein